MAAVDETDVPREGSFSGHLDPKVWKVIAVGLLGPFMTQIACQCEYFTMNPNLLWVTPLDYRSHHEIKSLEPYGYQSIGNAGISRQVFWIEANGEGQQEHGLSI